MTAHEQERWLKRIHRFLREDATVEVAWMPDASGCYVPDAEQILINPFFELVRILLHEAVHGVAPHLTEHQVKQKERELFRALSDRQLLYLMKRYLDGVIRPNVPIVHTHCHCEE